MKTTIRITPVILAGGSGIRLWPVSRKLMPKQFCKVVGEMSLFQKTLLRVAIGDLYNAPIIISGDGHTDTIDAQLRELDIEAAAIICEPVGRDTAAAIALTIEALGQRNNELMLVLPSDHMIDDVALFDKIVTKAGLAASDGEKILTLGITRTHPDTGLGYLRAGLPHGLAGICELDAFIEKPNQQKAEELFQSDNVYWNAGMFMFRPKLVRNELRKFMPRLFLQICHATRHGKWDGVYFRPDSWLFKTIDPISFDYAVMEKTDCAAVVIADFDWSDIGNWQAVWENHQKDDDNNSFMGEVFSHDVNDSLVITDGPSVAIAGLSDIVVVAQGDAILVTSRENPQGVKKLVEQMNVQHPALTLQHLLEQKTWGNVEQIDKGATHQTKRISINPGETIPSQYHHYSHKNWFIASGNPVVLINGKKANARPHDNFVVPQGANYRVENPTDSIVEIIEIQYGSYLGSDDVVYFKEQEQKALPSPPLVAPIIQITPAAKIAHTA